jgi:putative ABC transport system permease protein
MRIFRRIANLFSRSRIEREIEDELRSHIEMRIEENVAAGMSPQEARRAALLRFDNPIRTRERVASADMALAFSSFLADIRYAFRQMRRSPGFSLITILILAAGFAVSTAIFSAVRTVLLAPLPFRNPESLVQIVSRWPKTGAQNDWSAPLGDALDWKTSVPGFQDVAMYRYNLLNLTDGSQAESLYGVRATANLLPMLGVQPRLGKWFPEEYDRPNNNHVMLLSDDLWRQRFHADSHIVGKVIHFDGEGYQVLGVMPKHFNFPLRLGTVSQIPTDQMQYWMRLGADEAKERHGAPNAGVIARLRDGVSAQEAQWQLERACRRLQLEYPVTNDDLSAKLLSLRGQTVKQVNAPLIAMLAASALILLLTCANIASLLLARGEAHTGELAVRLALGGSSWRVARIPIMQGAVLCLCGVLLSVPLAVATLRLLVHLAPIYVPRLADTRIDGQALGFAAILAALTGMLVSGVNALQVLKRSPREVLSEGSRNSAGRPRTRLRNTLVIGQVALAVILMSGAGLMLRTFLNLQSADIGYNPDRVFYSVTVLPPTRYPASSDRGIFFRKLLDHLRATPGIELAAASTGFPLVGQYDSAKAQTTGTATRDRSAGVSADTNVVSSQYLEAVGVRLIRGRLIQESDAATTPKVAVIDQDLARQLWLGQDALGKLVNIDDPAKPVWREVVGVIAPTRNRSFDIAVRPGVFIPMSQGEGYINFVVVKSLASPSETARILKDAVAGIDSNQGVFFVQSMSELIQDSIATRRFLFVALIFFGVSALLLSAFGIYGLISFIAVSRVREVGIRMALGATRESIARLIVFEGVRLTLIGAIPGVAGSLLLSRLLSGLLFGVQQFDLKTLLSTVALLGLATVASAALPAWRSSMQQPMQVLRSE